MKSIMGTKRSISGENIHAVCRNIYDFLPLSYEYDTNNIKNSVYYDIT
jgi:hypothetical protein